VAFAHEAVELFAVARLAQVLKMLLEVVELFVEPAALLVDALQLLLAIVVKGSVAVTDKALVPAVAATARAAALKSIPRPFHPGLRLVFAAARVFAPENVGEDRKAERPEDDEAQHHQGDGNRRPGRSDQCAVHCGHSPVSNTSNLGRVKTRSSVRNHVFYS